MHYLGRRALSSAFVIVGAVTLVFFILYWLPGDPATLIAGDNATEETIERLRHRLGTDRPLWEQYIAYLSGLVHGDLGRSFSTNEPVLARLWAQLPSTLTLALFCASLAIVIGVLLGVVAAVKKDRWTDRAIQIIMLFLTSTPPFCFGILLILLFSVTLHWLPAIGSGSFAQLIMPAACLGLAFAGRLMRMVRSSVIDVLDEPFVTTLRGKGLLEWQVYGHVLRNALIPAVTFFGILIGELLSSVVVVETFFARQGVGRLLVESATAKDIPMIQGVVLVVSIFYVLINLFVDISYVWLDRRTQREGWAT